MLFTGPEKMDNDLAMYLQFGLSHDGNSVALCSTYLFGEVKEGQKTESGCALYLIDVSKAPHVVSKVPLALPKEDHPFK